MRDFSGAIAAESRVGGEVDPANREGEGMSDAADAGRTRRRADPARDTLPRVPVNGREEMAVVLLKHHRLLREYARYYIRDATEDAVEDAVERTCDTLLAIDQPSTPHVLRLATQTLYVQCQRTSRRLQREQAPEDPLLGPLTGRVALVLERLGPRSRDTIVRAARGATPTEIALAENSNPENVRVRLYRARRRAKQLLNEGGPSPSAVLCLVPGAPATPASVWLRGRSVVPRC
jgi:DNA-directed RNA polymerase specialized sigma24 family protein